MALILLLPLEEPPLNFEVIVRGVVSRRRIGRIGDRRASRGTSLMVEPVIVVPYDPRWPSLFALERSRVEAALGPWVEAVEHIGSTAVPGLDAKPVIDLMVGVRDIQGARRCIRPLEEIGYSYWAENPNPDRMLFVRFADAGCTSRTHNLHGVEVGGDLWNDRIVFRDHLRSHPEAAGEYARFKQVLAERFRDDREAYTRAKTDFISAMLERARASRA
jgi:GrpB-like predicted nucleotidyltransferase (UPF0157 family)